MGDWMNVNEVDVLSHNIRVFYEGRPYPYLLIQTGDHGWFLDKDIITEISPYTPHELSNWLFNWVEE